MCHKTCETTIAPVTAFQSVPQQPQPIKSTFRLSPFRKVAKSARINLNRYWGILSQSAAMKPLGVMSSTTRTKSSSETMDFSEEMEQNRINEMLEAQAEAAISDNERNSQYENSPDFSRRQHFRSNSIQSWTSSQMSSSTSSSPSSVSFPSDYFDTISQDSVFL